MKLYLIIVHDSVQGLDPHGVNVSIENNPLGAVVIDVRKISHDGGEQPCKERG